MPPPPPLVGEGREERVVEGDLWLAAMSDVQWCAMDIHGGLASPSLSSSSSPPNREGRKWATGSVRGRSSVGAVEQPLPHLCHWWCGGWWPRQCSLLAFIMAEGEAKGGRKKMRDILGNTRIHYSTNVPNDIWSVQSDKSQLCTTSKHARTLQRENKLLC